MQTDTLKITADDLLKRLNPSNDEEGWQYGINENYTEDDVIDILNEKEDTVLSMLPEGYRKLVRSTDYHGEIIVPYASAGQTSAQCGLFPVVSGTLKLFVDFPSGAPWVSHERYGIECLPDSAFTLNATTGAITFTTPLFEGSTVFATYDHTAASKLRMLKRLALDLAVVQIAIDNHIDMENYQIYKDMENTVYSTFKKMREKGDARLGIDMFDKLKLVVPMRSSGTSISW